MRILSLNQDKGIGCAKKKGASVHLRAIRAAFTELGHTVVTLDDPQGNALDELSASYSDQFPFDMLYERYALDKVNGSEFASKHNIPHILEVNAPLAEEAERWRDTECDDACAAAERIAFSNAQHIIAVSTDTKRYSMERGANEQNVTVIPNGFDPKVFYPRPKHVCKAQMGIRADKFVIGFHGRLRPWHRFDKLVDAIARLREDGLAVHLLTIGQGDYIDNAQPLPATDHTHFDWVEVEQLGEMVGAYDVLPLMYADDEPCYFSPLKLYEAMACGAVPVVPNVTTLRDTVRANQSGIIFEHGQLVESLKHLYQNRQQLKQMSLACVQQAETHTWRHVAETTLQVAGLQGHGHDKF